MSTEFAISLIDEINSSIDTHSVLQAIDFHADKFQESGETIKAFCPIHKDSRFRSLLVDSDRRAFRCTIKTCAGFVGGSLLELYALSRDISVLRAACEISENLQLNLPDNWQEELVSSYLHEAEASRQRGDLTEAETLLAEIVAAFPENSHAAAMLAGVHVDLGDTQAAAETYTDLIENYMASGKLQEALDLADEVSTRFPDDEDIRFTQVKIAEELGNDALAIEHMNRIISMREAAGRQLDNIGILEKLVEKNPHDTTARLKLAELYEKQHNLRAASRQYELAAQRHLDLGESESGIALLEKVITFNPENIKARLTLSRQLEYSGNIDAARDHTFRAINQYIDQQEFGTAISTVNNWLEKEPNSVDARELLARVYLDQDLPRDAVKHLVEAARIASRATDHTRATDLFLRAKFLTPDDIPLRRQLIQEFQTTGETQRAAFEVVDLAEILFSENETSEAVALLSDGIDQDISLPLKMQMITALANHGQTDAALESLQVLSDTTASTATAAEKAEIYELLVRLNPTDIDNHAHLFNSLWESAPDRAAESAAESIALLLKQNESAKAVALLETVHNRIDQYLPASGRLIELALQADRVDIAGSLYQLSIESLANDDPDYALNTAISIAQRDPAHPSAHSDIAYLLAALGRTDEAADQYASVAELLIQNSDYENALQYAREATALNPNSIRALAAETVAATQALPESESAASVEQLLNATRISTNRDDIAIGYRACVEAQPANTELLEEAHNALKQIDHPEALAHILSRQAMNASIAGDWESARQQLAEAFAIAPHVPQVSEQYGEACRITGDADNAARAFAESALAYIQQGDTKNAHRCAKSAHLANPASPDAWETLFNAAIAVDDPNLTIAAAQQLTKLHTEGDQPSTTARWAREWVRLDSDNPEAQKNLGLALLAVDQPDNAAAALSAAADIHIARNEDENAVGILGILVGRHLVTPAHRDSLTTILNRQQPGSPLHNTISNVLGKMMLRAGELETVRSLAADLPNNTAAADLWIEIAHSEQEPDRAADAWKNAADALQGKGDIDGAISALHSAAELGAPTLDIHQRLADLLTRTSQFDKALPHQLQVLESHAQATSPELTTLLQHLRTTHAADVSALTDIGRTLLTAGQREQALVDLENATGLATSQNNVAALISICGLDENLTRESVILTRARADALMGMENEQQALEWVATSGRSLMEAGNAEEARQMAERWISLAPDSLDAHTLFADASEATGMLDQAIDTRLKMVRAHIKNEDPAAALQLINDVLPHDPTPARSLRIKADIQKQLRDDLNASTTLSSLAAALTTSGDTTQALAALRESLSLNPQNIDAIWNKAELTRETENVAAAVPLYRQWLTLRRESGDANQWIIDLESILQHAPESTALLRDLTDALIQQGRAADAIPHLKTLAKLLTAEGDYRAAAVTTEQILAHSPVIETAEYIELANLYKKAKLPSQAREHLRHAINIYADKDDNSAAISAVESLMKLVGDTALPEDYSLAARVYAHAGDNTNASKMITRGLEELDRHSDSFSRREALLEQALAIAPLKLEYVLRHLDILAPTRAVSEGMRIAGEMQNAGHHDDAIEVLTKVTTLAPHDMSIRQGILEPLRKIGNLNRLREELFAITSDALSAGDSDAAIEALEEASGLVGTPQQHRSLAELNERARRLDQAAVEFTTAALMFAEAGKTEQAVASINRAVTARPLAIPADSMAELVRTLGPTVHEVAREQLRAALTARHQKQSQVLAVALLEKSNARQVDDIFKIVSTLGGATILVGIARQRIHTLLENSDADQALAISASLLTAAPDSPDAWHLCAQTYRQTGKAEDARRCAMEAARLFNMAGAVIEEETCYREALQAVPDDYTVRTTLADYLVREGRNEDAVQELEQVIRAAEETGNIDLLLENLNRAVQIAPDSPQLLEKLAQNLETIAPDSAIESWLQAATIYRDTHQHERARRIHEHVLSLNPLNETALTGMLTDARESANLEAATSYVMRLADLKAARKNIGEACRLLQAHLEIDPDNLEVLERLSDLAGASQDNEVFVTTTRALAKRFQKFGDNDNALHHYELLLQRNPRDVSLLTTLIDCTAAAGRPDKGLEFARQLLNVAQEMEDPEKIRLAAATILNYDDQDASTHMALGASLLSLNRVPEAITEWLRAAELFEGQFNNQEAFNCYRRVTQLSPSTLHAWRRLADIAIEIQDLDTARVCISHLLDKSAEADAPRITPLLDKFLTLRPDDEAIHEAALAFYRKVNDLPAFTRETLWLANHARSTENHDRAETYLASALRLVPDDPELKKLHYDIIRQLGRIEELQVRLRTEAEEHIQAERHEQAIATLTELTAIAPGQVSSYRELARILSQHERTDEALQQELNIIGILLDRGDLEEARETADSIFARYPDHPQAREQVADMLAEKNYPDVAARFYRTAAEEFVARKKNAPAISLLQKAIAVHPQWADARRMLAEICIKSKRPEDAFEAWVGLIPLLLEAGEYAEAEETLVKLSRLKPDSLELRQQRAELYKNTGQKDEHVRVLAELAAEYEKTGDAEKALECYRDISVAEPDDAAALTQYIELLTQSDPEAQQLSREYVRLAELLTRQGDYEGAFHTYEQVIGLTPDDTSARSRYATFLLTRGNRNRAVAEMRKLAKLYDDRNDFTGAVHVLNGALTISPRDADICLELAKAQEAAGLHDDAKVSYARASAILASTAAVKGIDTYRRILTQDEQNTAVRLRLVELLIKSGDKMEAAREARILAEIHVSRGETIEAKNAYRIVDECEPESLEDIRHAIQRDSYDPSLQYVHYVRLGDALFTEGDVDNALDSYRTARSLHDDSPELIQKCIECVSLIAPEAEAIPDYLLMAEKLQLEGKLNDARQAYNQVRTIDPFNNDARCALESLDATERQSATLSRAVAEDDIVLKAGQTITKRVALLDLLMACQDAANDKPQADQASDDSRKL